MLTFKVILVEQVANTVLNPALFLGYVHAVAWQRSGQSHISRGHSGPLSDAAQGKTSLSGPDLKGQKNQDVNRPTEEERQILSRVYIGVGFFYNEAMNVEYYGTWIYTTSLT